MAVVYADLRFARSSHKTDAAQVPTHEDWGLTYENVTSLRENEERKTTTPPKPNALRGACDLLTPYITAILSLLFLTFLAATIGLSVRLSQVSQNKHEVAARLEGLWGQHDDLNSSLTSKILTKDAEAQKLGEVLRQTKAELEQTKTYLDKSQEELRTKTQQLQRTIKEKEDLESKSRSLQDNVRNLNNKLQEKQTECDTNLRQAESQFRSCSQTLAQSKTSLTDTERKLRTTQNNLYSKDRELTVTKKDLQKVRSDLSQSSQSAGVLRKSLNDKTQILSDAEECFRNSCEGGRNLYDVGYGGFSYCPGTWKEINGKCYYFSSDEKMRYIAEEYCKKRGATLAKIEENDHIIKELIRKNVKSYWIGLRKVGKMWQWPDMSTQSDLLENYNSPPCVTASPQLTTQRCDAQLPWICQKKTETCNFSMDTLRCFGEKIGFFGEKHPGEDEL
ncbi:C-type lectin domain family 4 member F-like [Pseudophryne corroboree]|uniref:C-type lectin domain family 4 member F-like n=1 Tax=Pseudophryne corroboree TaxID=495146 RepID=UPI0030818F4C